MNSLIFILLLVLLGLQTYDCHLSKLQLDEIIKAMDSMIEHHKRLMKKGRAIKDLGIIEFQDGMDD